MNRAQLASLVLGLVVVEGCGSSPVVDDAGTPVDDAPVFDDAWAMPDAGPPIPPIDEYPPSFAANAVGPEDARFEGQQRFLWDTWGLEALDQWPPADFMVALQTSEPEVFGDQFSAFGFIPDADDDLPLGLKRGIDDATRIYGTCGLCHTGRLPDGRVWLGYPNRDLQLSRFQIEVNARWVAAGNAPLFDDESLRRLALHGPGRTGAETSSNPDVIPVEYPVSYRLAARTRLNYGGSGRDVRSESYLSIFGSGAGFPNAMEARVPFPQSARFGAFLSFYGSIDPPDAPAGDASMIAAGRGVFAAQRCNECHHVDAIGEDDITTLSMDGMESAPSAEHERGLIATDPGRTDIQGGDEGFEVYFDFIVRNRLMVSATDGYRPSDLHGLWASAPYLHNGSVPTLDDLLRPAAERPTTFLRGEFEVDTTAAGNGNQGHEFGTTLSEDDREALVAYLMSL